VALEDRKGLKACRYLCFPKCFVLICLSNIGYVHLPRTFQISLNCIYHQPDFLAKFAMILTVHEIRNILCCKLALIVEIGHDFALTEKHRHRLCSTKSELLYPYTAYRKSLIKHPFQISAFLVPLHKKNTCVLILFLDYPGSTISNKSALNVPGISHRGKAGPKK
jgi:hypothetical protein